MKHTHTYRIYSIIIILALFAHTTPTFATSICSFSTDLTTGSIGEDVRCLQKYLNENGYTISSSGPGSLGNETDLFQAKTREALKKWQESVGIFPATGTFGPVSRSVYDIKHKKAPVVTPSSVVPSTTTIISPATAAPASTPTPSSVPTSTAAPVSTTDASLKKLLKSTSTTIKDSIEKIDDAEDDGTSAQDITDMRALIDKAEGRLIDAVMSYIDGDYSEATTLLQRAQKYATDAVEDITDEEDREDADDAISDAKDAIAQARDDINEAEDDDQDTDTARDLYNDARAKLDDARESYDDEEYTDAIDFAQDAEKLAEKASDEL